ncbi:hypothetical protein BD779DRAFT_1683230 [Infundibulicybe gibba]|nr:hypothetical protein BD779DRAFT_1683230 [Infundibulicybe gibba]
MSSLGSTVVTVRSISSPGGSGSLLPQYGSAPNPSVDGTNGPNPRLSTDPNITLAVSIHPDLPTSLRKKPSHKYAPKTSFVCELAPYTTKFIQHEPPPGWVSVSHPQGALYFWNEQKHILTDTYICEPRLHKALEIAYSKITSLADKRPPDLAESSLELVIDVQPASEPDSGYQCGYYFVAHNHRAIFWPERVIKNELVGNTMGVTHPSHIQHRIESEYWWGVLPWHWHRFPNVQQVTDTMLDELKETLLSGSIELATNLLPTTVYEPEEASLYLSILSDVKPTQVSLHSGHAAYVIAPLMAIACDHKFLNFHGQECARLSRDQSVHEPAPQSTSYYYRAMSMLLFYSPEIYTQMLRTIFVDDHIFYVAWKPFVRELVSEWRDVTITATVLLTTNVAFLAIPGLDNGQQNSFRSPPQIISYLSILSSGWESLDERVMKNTSYLTDLGMKRLALMYGIPFGLISWGIILFLAAFLVFCFQLTSTFTRIFVALGMGLSIICWLGVSGTVGMETTRMVVGNK